MQMVGRCCGRSGHRGVSKKVDRESELGGNATALATKFAFCAF